MKNKAFIRAWRDGVDHKATVRPVTSGDNPPSGRWTTAPITHVAEY